MRERRNLISMTYKKNNISVGFLIFVRWNFQNSRKNGYFFYYSYSTKAKPSKLQRPNRTTVPSSSIPSLKKAKSFTSL